MSMRSNYLPAAWLCSSAICLLLSTGCNFRLGDLAELPARRNRNRDGNEATANVEMPRLLDHQIIAQPAIEIVHSDPNSVAQAFLNSLRIGDGRTTQKLLTLGANSALSEQGWQPLVPGNSAAYYHVGHVEYMEDQASAHVQCAWSDVGMSEASRQMTLVMRRETAGWRVAGLVSQTEQPTIYNFERPLEFMNAPKTLTNP